MSKISFIPANKVIDATSDQKLLVAMRKNQVPIRFGCASCKCGTCGVKVSNPDAFLPMKPDEQKLLHRMKLSESGDVRLACQARCSGTVDSTVDVTFQDTYSPDDGDGDGSLVS